MLQRKQNWGFLLGYRAYVLAFFIFLAAPLVAAAAFAFNDSLFPALPWRGFTLDWFFNDSEPKLGMFHDRRLLPGLYYSFVIATGRSEARRVGKGVDSTCRSR